MITAETIKIIFTEYISITDDGRPILALDAQLILTPDDLITLGRALKVLIPHLPEDSKKDAYE